MVVEIAPLLVSAGAGIGLVLGFIAFKLAEGYFKRQARYELVRDWSRRSAIYDPLSWCD